MFFIISKILSWLLFPLTWIILILVWRYFATSDKRKKDLLITAVVVFLLFTNIWLINSFAKIWDIKSVDGSSFLSKKYSCAILLGGFSNADEKDNGYFNSSADRFIQTVKLYKEGSVEKILVSGGNGSLTKEKFHEGEWVKGQLLAVGIPNSAILIENNSRSTLENAELSKKVLDSAGLQPPYVLVTSAFHMRRASWIFTKEGMSVVPFSSNFLVGGNKFELVDLLPQVHAMDLWSVYIKEVVGYYIYKLEFKRLGTK